MNECPRIVFLTKHFNQEAIDWVYKETGLRFEQVNSWSWVCQPSVFKQIVVLLTLYDVKIQYQNNATNRNTLYIKSDHNQGFKVDSICSECVKYNRLDIEIAEGERLAC